MSRHEELTIRPGRPSDVAPEEADLLHAAATDPEGFFAAGSGADGPAVARAAGVVRGDVLQVVHLSVAPRARGRGTGRALFAAVRAYGASRGARFVEVLSPADADAAGFLTRLGLPVRTIVLRLQAGGGDSGSGGASALSPVTLGAGLGGWVADLDRATRGFPRAPEWSRWIRTGYEVLSLRRHGRPDGIGALLVRPEGCGVGPVAGTSPDAAADLLALLTARARAAGRDVALAVPVEARSLLRAAFGAGSRVVGTSLFFSSQKRGDLRRYAGSPTSFF